MTKPKFLTALDLFEPSMKAIVDNLVPYTLILVIPSLLTTVGELSTTDNFGYTGVGFLGALLTIGLVPPLTKLYLLSAKGKTVKLGELFTDSYKYFWRLIGLALIVGLVLIIGLILFIIPGLIMLRRYVLSAFYLMDEDLGIFDAMKKSADHTKPYSWKMYEVIAMMLVIGLVGIFGVFGMIASTILGVIYTVAMPIRYYEIKNANKVKAVGK